MTTANRITGPGYYPKRPAPRRPIVVGKPDKVCIISTRGLQWDSRYWDTGYDKPTRFSIQINNYSYVIQAIEITDRDGALLYTQTLPEPVDLRTLHAAGRPFQFVIDVDWRIA